MMTHSGIESSSSSIHNGNSSVSPGRVSCRVDNLGARVFVFLLIRLFSAGLGVRGLPNGLA